MKQTTYLSDKHVFSNGCHLKDKEYPNIDRDKTVLLGFIAGMSRSGTTWMARSLNTHPEIAVFGESKFWGKSFVKPKSNKGYSVKELKRFADILKKVTWKETVGNTHGCLKNIEKKDINSIIEKCVEKQKENSTPEKIYIEIVKWVAALEQKKYVVEKVPHYSIYFERVKSYLPWTKTVFIVRDPLEFVVSFKHQHDSKGSRARENALRKKHSAINSIIWRTYMRNVKRAANDYPEHCMIINMNDIRSDPDGVLSNVQLFFGVENSVKSNVVSKTCNTSFPTGKRKEITQEDIFWLKLIAKKELKEFDITLPRSELGFISIIRSFFKLIMASQYIVNKSLHFEKSLHLKKWLRAIFSR